MNRRNNIEILEMPKWLLKNEFEFDVNVVLENSFYYPCSHFDGGPVKHFMGNVYSFLYVDYGVSREDFLNELKNRGFRGYHIIYQRSISQNELTPNGWTVYIPPGEDERNPNDYYPECTKNPFCEWVIFERAPDKDDSYNPKRFSLLFLCADGAAAYQAIYLSNNIKPRIVAIIQPGHCFGGNWTIFTDREKIFARSVCYKRELLPDYLINGGYGKACLYENSIWDEYTTPVKMLNAGISTIKVWKRSE